jgi:hypothetical protein
MGRLQSRPALILAVLAQADHPRRLVPHHDDSDVDSCTCPCSATLDGIPGRIPSARLLSPLGGLMVSRCRRGYALTSIPEGQEFHLHGDQVIKDQTDLSSLSPTTLVRLWFEGNGSHPQAVVRHGLGQQGTELIRNSSPTPVFAATGTCANPLARRTVPRRPRGSKGCTAGSPPGRWRPCPGPGGTRAATAQKRCSCSTPLQMPHGTTLPVA